MSIDLNDIRETTIRYMGNNIWILKNEAIMLDETVDEKELKEILSSLSEFVYELAYTLKG